MLFKFFDYHFLNKSIRLALEIKKPGNRHLHYDTLLSFLKYKKNNNNSYGKFRWLESNGIPDINLTKTEYLYGSSYNRKDIAEFYGVKTVAFKTDKINELDTSNFNLPYVFKEQKEVLVIILLIIIIAYLGSKYNKLELKLLEKEVKAYGRQFRRNFPDRFK